MATTHTWVPSEIGYLYDPSKYTDARTFAPGDTLVVTSGNQMIVSKAGTVDYYGYGSEILSLLPGTYKFSPDAGTTLFELGNMELPSGTTVWVNGPNTLTWSMDRTVINDGLIQVGSASGRGNAQVFLGTGSVKNLGVGVSSTGMYALSPNFITLSSGAVSRLFNTGTISAQNGSTLKFTPEAAGATITNTASGVISVSGGSTLIAQSDSTGYHPDGTHDTNVVNDGLISVGGAAGVTTGLLINGNYSGAGLLSVRGAPGAASNTTYAELFGSANGTFEAADGNLMFHTSPVVGDITFLNDSVALVVDAWPGETYGNKANPFGATLHSFRPGDLISLKTDAPITASAYDPASGVLTLSGQNGTVARLEFAGTYAPGAFQLGASELVDGKAGHYRTSITTTSAPGSSDYVAATVRASRVSVAANGDVTLLRQGQSSVLHGAAEVDFVDGRLVFDPNDPAASVARLYQAALGRAPDAGGLSYWADAVRHGASLGQLARGFLGSPEFTARFGQGGGNADFVGAIYRNVLGRAPDAAGSAYWTGLLDRGTSRADVLVGISESAENKQATAALVKGGLWVLDPEAAQAARLYDTVFGRTPDAAGLAYWTRQLDAGTTTLQAMADAFVASTEFQKSYGASSNRDFVQRVYTNTLDRPGDAGGVNYWTASLDAGASRAQVVVAFSESAEHQRLTAPAIAGTGGAPGQYGILTA